MKRSIIYFLTIVLFFIASCDDTILKPEVELKEGLNIQIGNSILFTEKDIDYYDHSSHYFYFNKPLKQSLSNYGNSKFWITNSSIVIYEGILKTSECGCLEGDSTLIYDNYEHADFVLKLGHYPCYNSSTNFANDYRESKAFINELSQLGFLHPGLECIVDSIQIIGDKRIKMYHKICNYDTWNYYFPDPERIPENSTYDHNRRLRLYEKNTQMYALYHSPEESTLLRVGKKDTSLLMLIKAGESISRVTEYSLSNNISPGNYKIYLKLPGLGQDISYPEERELAQGKIWLGEILMHQDIDIK
ncbi:MAG: hypothetical protein K9H26_08765 [Prolixibacteraceae bacterium]|nr:hypothetical protein [Prolixibacteraceae bacterium]